MKPDNIMPQAEIEQLVVGDKVYLIQEHTAPGPYPWSKKGSATTRTPADIVEIRQDRIYLVPDGSVVFNPILGIDMSKPIAIPKTGWNGKAWIPPYRPSNEPLTKILPIDYHA